MRIGIDVRYLSHGLVGGVHNYVKSFVPELLRIAHNDDMVLYADTKRPFELTELPSNTKLRLLPYRSAASSIWHDLTLRRSMAADQLDVVHFPANYGFGPTEARCVITLHDEINVQPLPMILEGHKKDARTIGMMTYLHLFSRAAIQRADRILTVSVYAAQQIAQYTHLPLERIIAIHHGRATDLGHISDHAILHTIRQRYKIQESFVLADALKNPAVVVRAWRRLPESLRQSHKIVFFARHANPLPIVQDAVDSGDAILLIRPPREDLIGLFSMAKIFVFPSWIEGFGIPLLEAMSCGAPVIASDRGSIPEVLGGAGLICDAEDDGTLAQMIGALLLNAESRAIIRKRGYERAQDFSWTKTAQAILHSYQLALGQQPVQAHFSDSFSL